MSNPVLQKISGFLSITILAYYIFMAFYTSTGLPWNLDDLAIFIDDLNDFYINETGLTKFKYLFVLRHNVHINFPSRLINLFGYYATGKVDFTFITICSSLFLPVFIYALYRAAKFKSLLGFLPIVLMLGVYVDHINSWPTASIYPFTILFPFLAFYFASKNKLYRAMAFSIISFISVGNGILVFPLILLMIIMSKDIPNKRIFQWLVFCALIFIANFYISEKVSNVVRLEDKAFLDYAQNLVDLLSSPIKFMPLLSEIDSIGFVLALVFCFGLIYLANNISSCLAEKNIAVLFLFVYLFGTVCAISILREVTTAPRYELTVFTIWSLLYLLLYNILLEKNKVKYFLILSLIFISPIAFNRFNYNYTRIPYSKLYQITTYRNMISDNMKNKEKANWARNVLLSANEAELYVVPKSTAISNENSDK